MRSLSALDYYCIIKELQLLTNARLDKIYHPSKKELLLQFYVSSKGKEILKIVAGKALYLTTAKPTATEPDSFCIFLRKNLMNARLKKIEQLGFERIIKFSFAKEKELNLIIELFDKGNIILVDNKNKIINCLEQQKWKDREIKKDLVYSYPKKDYNFLELKIKDLKALLKKSDLDLVRTLATQLGLGGLYSEETCLLANVDKTRIANQLTEKDINAIFDSLLSLKNKAIDPRIVCKNNEILDIIPFDLKLHKDLKQEKFKTFNSALNGYFIKQEISPEEKARSRAIQKQLVIIEKQKERISQLEKEIDENQAKAELIYSKYSLIKEILEQINTARKKYSWQEIKEKLKGHKIITEINAKEKKITIEI